MEYHRQTLARSLCVPEHTDATVAVDGRLRALYGFVYRKILVVAGENLAVAALVLVEADEVAKYIEESPLLKHSLKKDVIVHDFF